MKKGKGRFFVLFLFVISATVLFGYFVNTILFQRSLNGVVGEYVSENNRQLAAHVSYRLKSGSEYISDFADTLSRMPEFLLTEDLLSRKAEALELEGIIVISDDGSYLANQEISEEFQEWISNNPNIWEKSKVSYIENHNIIFSAPVIKDSKTKKVVIGLQSYQELQALVSRDDFQEQGVNILLDVAGQKPVMIEKGIANSMEKDQIIEIIRGLFSSDNNKKMGFIDDYYIAADWVSSTEWLQIVILPTSFTLSKSQSFINVYFLLMVVTLLLFGFVIVHFKKEEAQRERIYISDMLTGGLNREGFLNRTRDLIDYKNETEYTLLCLNVKNFRMVNETWGEDIGNQILEIIYRTLNKLVSKGELVCRNSMDHFLLLLHEQDKKAIERRLARMFEMINHDIQKQYFGYQLEFATGVCRLENSLDIALAINYATYASKQAKNDVGCVYYNGEIAQTLAREKELNGLFEGSLQNRDFKVYLQPKVSINGKCNQAEALVRWIHPVRGMIYPNQFIPLFEKNNRICELDLYMFEEVCKLMSERIAQGLELFEVSVNISRFHLRSAGENIWKEYQKIKNHYQIPDGLIELELTETLMIDMTQLGFVKNVLAGFRSCGLKVALDDFGFAYSSLALLKEFEVDTLKMDKSFFINENLKSRKIVQSVIQLAHNLDMRVVAEGIEDFEQVEVLHQMGCDLIQGYVYSKPLSIDEFEVWRNQCENE